MNQHTLTTDLEIADALIAARSGGEQVDAERCAIADFEQAYRIQALVLQRCEAGSDASPHCWKSGGASRQTELTHALLPSAGIWVSPAQAGGWPFRIRGVEAEIALRLGRTVDATLAAQLSEHDSAQLIDAMTVSIEMVDSRWRQGVEVSPAHKLADHQLHGALILGAWQPYQARDWSRQSGEVRIGSQRIAFSGSHPLQDPAWLLPCWLRHATQHNRVLPAGTVVTTGSWCGMPLAQPGDEVTVVFQGLEPVCIQL